jgi:hypothetical protein
MNFGHANTGIAFSDDPEPLRPQCVTVFYINISFG